MARILFLLFTVVPLAEIALLVWIATKTSALFVVGLVIGVGLLGLALLRLQSWHTLRRVADELERGRMPADALVDGLVVLVAAVFLILPGVLTDVVAIALLFPPSRRAIKALVRRRLEARLQTMPPFSATADRDRIIDVKVLDGPGGQGPR